MLWPAGSEMRVPTMGNILYFVTGPSLDGAYGIAAIDRMTGETAVVMHFLKHRADAELLAEHLNQTQMPIPGFCHTALSGELLELDWLKSPG